MLCAEDELGIGASHVCYHGAAARCTTGRDAGREEYLHIEDDYLIGVDSTLTVVQLRISAWRATFGGYLRAPGGDAEALAGAVARRVGVRSRRSCVGDRRHGRKCRAAPFLRGSDDHRLQDPAPSPDWMQKRAACGLSIHPKNNLVDITNYVLFELGPAAALRRP